MHVYKLTKWVKNDVEHHIAWEKLCNCTSVAVRLAAKDHNIFDAIGNTMLKWRRDDGLTNGDLYADNDSGYYSIHDVYVETNDGY